MQENLISGIQKQFWLLQKVYKNNTAYNIPLVMKINGIPDIDALEYALNQVVLKYEELRICFEEKDGDVFRKSVTPDQYVLKIERIGIDDTFNKDSLPEKITEEIHGIFKLNEWPLIRMKLFIFAEGISVLTIVFHHVIVDLHSKKIFAEEFSEFYNSCLGRYKPLLNGGVSSYSEYSGWLAEWLKSDEAYKMTADWKKYIPRTPDALEIPSDFIKPRVNDLEGNRIHFGTDNHLYKKIVAFAEDNSINSFSVLLTAYAILLNRLTNQQEIIIGVPFTNRRKEEFKDTFGCFVNIVPVLVTFNEGISGSDLLKQIRNSLLKIHRMQEIPFLLLNDLLKKTGSNSILQCGFTVEPPVEISLNELEIQSLIVEKQGSQLDLFLTLWEQDESVQGCMEFSTLMFKEQTISRFINIYLRILEEYFENPSLAISELDIISDEEIDMITEWNNTDHDYSRDICLHQKFEQQVKKTPDSIALIFGDDFLTYSEFDSHVNRMANYLISQGVGTEDIICVCMERSLELMIAIYGIHKAGAAYLPVDPSYPPERLEMILSDANPKLILSKEKSSQHIPAGYRTICIDSIIHTPLSVNDKAPVTVVSSRNTAYLMYTSGSTGKPKGVIIEHHSVINKLEWMQFQHPLSLNDTILLKTPVTFDVSVWELFWWMFNGARLAILPPGGEKDPKQIIDEIESKKVTTIVFVPSMFSPFIGYVKTRNLSDKLVTLKWIIQIGEALSPQVVNTFNELLTNDFNPLMVNTYGPTEATVAVSWFNCPKENNVEKIYIGKPIWNTKLLVINSMNKIQPVGVPGELIITGVNLSRGYLNRPELNAEKFFDFKYLNGQAPRAYRTGDLVRWSEDGNIDFIGRADNQVKIRGFRIELGDIESKLLEVPEIKAAAVIVKEMKSGNKYIAAYVVLKESFTSSSDEIKRILSAKLPDYMIPAHIMILNEMPLNTSGKLDRKALPEPEFIASAELVPPVSFYEKKLQQIWMEVLDLEKIGITHNFFDIGGNSLLAVHIINVINQKFEINLDPIHILNYPNISGLARFISEQKGDGSSQVTVEEKVRKQNFTSLRQKRNVHI